MKRLEKEHIREYKNWLIEEEKSKNTVDKYVRDIQGLYDFLPENKKIDKSMLINYKEYLIKNYAISSINSMLISINGFLKFMGWNEYGVKLMRCQKQIFCEKAKELTKEEYMRLLETAKKKNNRRLRLLMETICGMGIRVSELEFITMEATIQGRAEINCKGKRRIIFVPEDLRIKLIRYARDEKIISGHIFRTKNGKPLDRSNIWSDMKKLCNEAGVDEKKVFPHNLRHLFARTFYSIDKDIISLADLLGHSSVNTTRIYTITSGEEHVKKINRLGLVMLQ